MEIPNMTFQSRWPIAILLILSSCIASIQTVHAGQHELLLTDLKNATYTGIETDPITLRNGQWQGLSFVEGGASRPRVGLLENFHFAGDLDGDGLDEVVAILWQNSGGTGSNVYIAVMRRQDEGIENTATALIGDRVKLRSGKIESGKVFLDVLQAGENDAMCCPTQLATRSWLMAGNQLQEGKIEMTGKLSLAALDETEWVLTHIGRKNPVGKNIEVTLAFSEDRISGKSACNRYSAGVTEGDNAGDINIGPAMGTRMACEEELMNMEQLYLEKLSRVNAFDFHAGRLALNGQDSDGNPVQMLFTRAQPGNK